MFQTPALTHHPSFDNLRIKRLLLFLDQSPILLVGKLSGPSSPAASCFKIVQWAFSVL